MKSYKGLSPRGRSLPLGWHTHIHKGLKHIKIAIYYPLADDIIYDQNGT